MQIITNNPAVFKAYPESIRVDGSPVAVLREVRDRIHRNQRLLGHPLAGSIRLMRNPFRTVVLETSGMAVDGRDLLLVEDAIGRLTEYSFENVPPHTIGDYQLVDLGLVEVLLASRA